MSETSEKIETILSQTEGQLRDIIAEAAKQGDYRGVDAARHIAVSIQEIKGMVNERHSVPTKSDRIGMPSNAVQKKRKSVSKKSRSAGYPRFRISENVLTKIGWSKRQKSEYTHKVSRSIFDRTLKSMVTLTNGRTGPFTAEQIINVVNKSEEEFIPSYQVYIVIAFLRSTGCIQQQGRDGYHIPIEVESKAEEAWKKVCKKK